MKIQIAMAVALALVTWLYMGKRDELAAEIEASNTRVMAAVAESRRVTSKRLSEAHERDLAEKDQRYKELEIALQDATENVDLAKQGTAERDKTILQLQMEASIDEMPDSSECLNAYVPSGVLYTEDCSGALSGGSAGSSPVCRNIGDPNQTDPAFSTITYGELISMCNANIDTIEILNSNLGLIESLNEQTE